MKKNTDKIKQKSLLLTLSRIVLIVIFLVVTIVYLLNVLGVLNGSKSQGGLASGTDKTSAAKNIGDYDTPFDKHIRTGDVIEFAGISWDVLDRDGNTFLLITHNCLEFVPWDDGSSTNGSSAVSRAGRYYYEYSSIRNYLNNTVVPKLFTKEELKYITPVAVRHDNSAIRPNNEYATDYAFLLNEKTAQYYADKMYVNESFWLGERSYKESSDAMCYTGNGLSRTDARTSLGLRPAIYVTIDNPPLFPDADLNEFINSIKWNYYSIPCYQDGAAQYGFIQFQEDRVRMQGWFVCNFVDGEPQSPLDTELFNGEYYYSDFTFSKNSNGNYELTDIDKGVKFEYTEADRTWHYYSRNYNGYEEYGIKFGEFVELIPYVYSEKNDQISASIQGIETEVIQKQAEDKELSEALTDDMRRLMVKDGYRIKDYEEVITDADESNYFYYVFEYDSNGYLNGISNSYSLASGKADNEHITITYEDGCQVLHTLNSTYKAKGCGLIDYYMAGTPVFEDCTGVFLTDELTELRYDKYGYELFEGYTYDYLAFDEKGNPTEIKLSDDDGYEEYYDVSYQYDENGLVICMQTILRGKEYTIRRTLGYEKVS